MKYIIQGIKVIKKSKVLTEKEKSKLIKQALIETVVNSWRDLLCLPFYIVAATVGLIGEGLELLGDGLQTLAGVVGYPISKIQELPYWHFADKELSKKLRKGIIEENTYTIKSEDIKNL